jgi:hypothetical protein
LQSRDQAAEDWQRYATPDASDQRNRRLLALKQIEPAAGGQGVWVVGSQDPEPGVEDLPEFGFGVSGLALVGQHPGDIVPGGQGVWVVGSLDPVPLENRIRLVTCGSSGCQAARVYR